MTDAQLRQLIPRHLSSMHCQAVETGSTGRGIPDLNFCADGIEGWIELKRAIYWRVEVRPEQVGFIERRLRAGGRVFVAARRQLKRVDELWLYHGAMARRLVTERLDAVPHLGQWSGGPKAWNWEEVRAILLGPFAAAAMPANDLENATHAPINPGSHPPTG